jgi:hypothetical protein
MLETVLEEFPKEMPLKDGLVVTVRPLEAEDEMSFHEFFLAVPERERMFIKHRVTDPAVIRDWCQRIDLGHKLPLLAVGKAGFWAAARCTNNWGLEKAYRAGQRHGPSQLSRPRHGQAVSG